MSNDPTHEFIRPGQVSPGQPAPDYCVVCGLSQAVHTTATYVAESAAADAILDEQLAMIRAEESTGDITPAQAATERIEAMEAHLAEIRHLRDKHFGKGENQA